MKKYLGETNQELVVVVVVVVWKKRNQVAVELTPSLRFSFFSYNLIFLLFLLKICYLMSKNKMRIFVYFLSLLHIYFFSQTFHQKICHFLFYSILPFLGYIIP